MFKVEFYDSKGNLDHNTVVASLHELQELAQGRTIKITGPATLDHAEAMEVINEYKVDNKLPGLLETLEHMRDHPLTFRQGHAFRTIYGGFQKLFAPVGDE